MKIVFTTDNNLEAHMVKHFLEENGIRTDISGEALMGARGDLAANTPITISIIDENDFDRARKIIVNMDKRNNETENAESTQYGKRHFILRTIPLAIISFLFGAILVYSALYVPPSAYEYDHNGDGKTDEILHYKNGVISKIETDRNFDEKFDFYYDYDSKGQVFGSKSDDDFDGEFETISSYKNGNIEKTDKDLNKNGFPDVVFHYKNGVLSHAIFYYPASQIPAKKVEYKNDIAVRSLFDSDGDGAYDREYLYDGFEEIKTVRDIKSTKEE